MADKEYVLRITDKEGCRGPGESIFDLLAPAQHEAMLMSTDEQYRQHFDSVQVCELVPVSEFDGETAYEKRIKQLENEKKWLLHAIVCTKRLNECYFWKAAWQEVRSKSVLTDKGTAPAVLEVMKAIVKAGQHPETIL